MAETPSENGNRQRAPAAETAERRRPVRPKRRTRFIFKLLGVGLVGLAGWMVWYSYREHRLPDWLNPAEQKRAATQAQKDWLVARDWVQISLEELRQRIKGPPPDTREEIAALVAESRQNTVHGLEGRATTPEEEKATAPAESPERASSTPAEKGRTPAPPATPLAAARPPAPGPLDAARREYALGEEAYAKTDPNGATAAVQANLRRAEPCFVRCLELLDRVPKGAATAAELERFEQAAARRLYDCRKRMALPR